MEAARLIAEKEGLQGISIRKVAKEAGFTEGSIYNYFENKQVLLRHLIQEGFETLMAEASWLVSSHESAEAQIIKQFQSYTEAVMKMPEYYQAVMLSDDPHILSETAVLNDSLRNKPGGIDRLAALLEKGMSDREFAIQDPLLTAKIIWSAIFGILIRFIIEGLSRKEGKILIDEQLNLMIGALKKKGDML